MKDAAWRVLIAVATALLIVATYLMILLTSPQMLVGVHSNESVKLVVTSVSATQSDTVFPININTATATELIAVPELGQTLADRIVKYREENGSFDSVDDLKAIEGIGDGRVSKWRDYLAVK